MALLADSNDILLLSFSSPLGSRKIFAVTLLIETLVCMPLPLTPTSFGKKQAVQPHVGGHLAANSCRAGSGRRRRPLRRSHN